MATCSLHLAKAKDGYINIEDLGKLLAPLSPLSPSHNEEKYIIYIGQIWPLSQDKGLNPHPKLIYCLYKYLQAQGIAKPQIAFNCAPGYTADDCLTKSGLTTLNIAADAFYNLDNDTRLSRNCSHNLATSKLDLPKTLLMADCLINVAKYRHKDQLLFGSAFYNLASAADLNLEDPAFQRKIVDLYTVIQPDLHIIDSIIGNQGFQNQSLILAAQDGLAIDITMASLSGLFTDDIEYMQLAAQYGLGIALAGEINICGDDLRRPSDD